MPDASMPHSSGPEVGEELTEGRAVCERCRRPGQGRGAIKRGLCLRRLSLSDPECDRLLLERAQTAERQLDRLDELERQMTEQGARLSEVFARQVEVEAERDALAEAGDALARRADDALADLRAVHGERGMGWPLGDALARWRSLRSPKGAGNGD